MSDRRKRELGPDSPSRILGRQVQAAREQKRPRWSQNDLATELLRIGSPIDRAALQKIEQGARKGVTLEELFEIAAALDVNPVQLVTSPDDPEVPRPEDMDLEEWEYQRVRGLAGPNMQVTPTRKARAQAVREWLYGHHPLSLGTADPTLYRRFISDPEHAQREAAAGGGFYSRDSSGGVDHHSLEAIEGRKAKPARKKRGAKKGSA